MVIIPSTIADLPVTSIGDWSFYSTGVTNVLIPDSVTNIGDGVFFDCESLTNVTIGSSVTNIGDWTFGFCPNLMSICCRGNEPSLGGSNVFYGNLATIYYLSGATGWGPTFDGHPAILWNPPVPFTYTTNSDGITLSITGYTGSGSAVTIPGSINFLPVTSIDSCQFSSGVTSVTVPDSVTNIGFEAFEAFNFPCFHAGPPPSISLSAITVDTNNPVYSSLDGVLLDKIQGTLIQYPCGNAGSNYMIPDSVTDIAIGAFCNCTYLGSVTIPDSITNIESGAFCCCFNLTNAIIGNSVTSIGDYAFSGTSLSSVTIGTNVTSIGGYAFAYCNSLTSVTIPDSVTSIGNGAFFHCASLTSVTIPRSVTGIGEFAFSSCRSLTGVYFQGNAPSVGSDVFEGDPATVYYLPGTTGWYDFAANTGVPTAPWPFPDFSYIANNGTVTITGYTGSGGDVTIPNTIYGLPVTSIGAYAFFPRGGLTSLTNVIIPDSITSIGNSAFEGCLNLTSVMIPNSATNIGTSAFGNCASLTEIMVDVLNLFYSSVDGVLFDKSTNTLIQCPGAKAGSYTIPRNVTAIGNGAFASCTRLNCVTIGNSVTNIEGMAFYQCTALTNVTIPNSITSIGDVAFAGTSLNSITIPNSVTSIGGSAFAHCSSLTNVTIGNGVTNIGDYAFFSCYTLASVTLGNGVMIIGGSAFYDCYVLTNITIPKSVTIIGDQAFLECVSLTGVYFEGDAPSTDPSDSAFFYDYNATIYYLPGTTGWGLTYGARPTVLWNPQVQNDSSFGMQTNQFGFTITGSSNLVIVVEACTNLASPIWTPIGTKTLNTYIDTNGTSYFSDPQWTNYPARFYRLQMP